MEYENKFVGLLSVTSNDLKLLRYELEFILMICFQRKEVSNDVS